MNNNNVFSPIRLTILLTQVRPGRDRGDADRPGCEGGGGGAAEEDLHRGGRGPALGEESVQARAGSLNTPTL